MNADGGSASPAGDATPLRSFNLSPFTSHLFHPYLGNLLLKPLFREMEVFDHGTAGVGVDQVIVAVAGLDHGWVGDADIRSVAETGERRKMFAVCGPGNAHTKSADQIGRVNN